MISNFSSVFSIWPSVLAVQCLAENLHLGIS